LIYLFQSFLFGSGLSKTVFVITVFNMSIPPNSGLHFTNRLHSKAEGPTDPANVKLPPNFVAVVTGAGKGLGFHIALAFAQAGASGISISSRTRSDLDELTAELSRISPNLKIASSICDTTKDEDVKQLADDVRRHFGRAEFVLERADLET
jgi:hypothetical protein